MTIITQNKPAQQPPSDDTLKQWRKDSALALWRAGHDYEAEAFYFCGDETKFSAIVQCSADPEHYSAPIPHTCHRRYCPDCERRANAKRFKKYMPVIEQACNFGRRDFSLKHIVLTTPYSLDDDDISERYAVSRRALGKVIERVMFLTAKDNPRIKVKPDELRRGRVSLRQHGMGLIVGDEFGEDGHKLHYHLLFYGPFIPKPRITETWQEYTNSECEINHIKKVDTHEGAREVMMKYATKLTLLPPALVPKLRDVLHGVRRIRTYGIFYNVPPIEEDRYHACPHCDAPLDVVWLSSLELPKATLDLKRGHKSGAKDPPEIGYFHVKRHWLKQELHFQPSLPLNILESPQNGGKDHYSYE